MTDPQSSRAATVPPERIAEARARLAEKVYDNGQYYSGRKRWDSA